MRRSPAHWGAVAPKRRIYIHYEQMLVFNSIFDLLWKGRGSTVSSAAFFRVPSAEIDLEARHEAYYKSFLNFLLQEYNLGYNSHPHLLVVYPVLTNEEMTTESQRYNCFTRNGGNAIPKHAGPEAKGSNWTYPALGP